jgi:hypothetical protein
MAVTGSRLPEQLVERAARDVVEEEALVALDRVAARFRGL